MLQEATKAINSAFNNSFIKKLSQYLHDCVREEVKSSTFRNLKGDKDNKWIFLEGEEKNKVAKEALISLAWVIAHHLTALCETEDSPEYLRKASQILDILFEGENEDDFVKAIRQRLQ